MKQTLFRFKYNYNFSEGLKDFSDLYLFLDQEIFNDYYIYPSSINDNNTLIQISFNPVSNSEFLQTLDAVIINYPQIQSNFNSGRYRKEDYINEINYTYNSIKQMHTAYGKVIEIIRRRVEIDKRKNRLQVGQLVFKNINNLNNIFYEYELNSNQIIDTELTKTYKVVAEK